MMSLERTRRNLLALASVIAPLAGLIVWLIADPAWRRASTWTSTAPAGPAHRRSSSFSRC